LTGDAKDDASSATAAGVEAAASRARANYVVAAADAAESANMKSTISELRDRDRVRARMSPVLAAMPTLSGTNASRAINTRHVTVNATSPFEFRFGGRTTTCEATSSQATKSF
jgi:hypothetical protein